MAFKSALQFLPDNIKADLSDLCGIDEVGRGCWAGPLVASAFRLYEDIKITALKDSKQLSKERREEVFAILSKARDEGKCAFGVGISQVAEIDDMGVIRANNLAFVRALEEMDASTTSQKRSALKFLLVDGRDKLILPLPHKTVIKGDEKIKIIACASIIAKVTRDKMMSDLALKYPNYGFELHKGYGTEQHQKALNEHGITPIHRRHYKPVYMTMQATLPFGD